jgi:hypothetical protein
VVRDQELADFSEAQFKDIANFSGVKFNGVDFNLTKFLAKVYFVENEFSDKTIFRETLFEQQNKVIFNKSNLSKVSFADSDIIRIKFGDKVIWGGQDGFTIIEEEWLRVKGKGQRMPENENVSLNLVLSVYRNLRENYEFRLRYDDAGKFFIKEMELKRKYREIKSGNGLEIKENGRFRKHFSLTGLDYHLFRYDESISRPATIGALTVFLSTLFWITQSNPSLEPHFDPV